MKNATTTNDNYCNPSHAFATLPVHNVSVRPSVYVTRLNGLCINILHAHTYACSGCRLRVNIYYDVAAMAVHARSYMYRFRRLENTAYGKLRNGEKNNLATVPAHRVTIIMCVFIEISFLVNCNRCSGTSIT